VLGFVAGEFVKEVLQIVPRELPFEGLGDRFVVRLEGQQPLFQGSQVREVIGCQHLSLDDREVDLDLI